MCLDPLILSVMLSRLSAASYRAICDRIMAGDAVPSSEQALTDLTQPKSSLARGHEVEPIRRTLDEFLNSDGKLISIFDQSYPLKLRRIAYPPPLIYARGELALLERALNVGIVGSRSADPPAWSLVRGWSSELSRRGVCIVSGLAIGVDSAAHQGAIESGAAGSTIAVLGSGLNHLHPRSNLKLYESILATGGLVLSQFELDEKPFPQNFLNRNRLVSALSDGVLVVQASERSGSLVTARYALEQGKELMVIPGSLFDLRYAGSNELIKKGAYLITSMEDVAEVMHIPAAGSAACGDAKVMASGPKARIAETIRRGGRVHTTELQQRFPSEPLFEILLELELEGLIASLPGNFWAPPNNLQ